MRHPQLLNSSLSLLLALFFLPLSLFSFSVFLVCGGMLTCTLKGLWLVCEWQIVPKPLTKVLLKTWALPATMNNTAIFVPLLPQLLVSCIEKQTLKCNSAPTWFTEETTSNNRSTVLWAHEVKRAGIFSGVEFKSKVAGDA